MKYQLFSPLSAAEYEALKASIGENGVLVPIEYAANENGELEIIDGHHRLKICEELNITDFPRNVRLGLSETEKRMVSRALNMSRRSMSREQRQGQIKGQLLDTPEKSDRRIAIALGVSNSTVSLARKALIAAGELCEPHTTAKARKRSNPKTSAATETNASPRRPIITLTNPNSRALYALETPGVMERLESRQISNPIYAQRIIKQGEKSERKNKAVDLTANDVRLFVADLRGGLPEVEDNSVDLIIADPPYGAEYVPLYSHLPRIAGRVLREGGSVLCMCGKSRLNETLPALCLDPRIRYHWTIACTMPQAAPPLHWLHVSSHWRVIVWLTKGTYNGDLVSDLMHAPAVSGSEKEFHKWGQPEAVFAELIERFSDPRQAVLDCCVGGGNSAVAAVTAQRRFIGSDIDPECVAITRGRIEGLFLK